MLNLVLATILVSHSVTLSPVSFTYHNFDDKDVERDFKHQLSDSITYHPGLQVKYEHAYFQGATWYFRDSFDRNAGGLVVGPKLDFLWIFQIGAVAGVYAREYNENNPMNIPFSTRVGPASISPMAGLTGSVTIPISPVYGLDTTCLTNWKLTNCSIGLNIRW